MKEQGFKYEFDETDRLAKHMLLFEDDIPVATCRFFFSVERDCYVIGRIAVSKEFRGKQYGKKMLQGAEKTVSDLGGKRIELSAQCRVAEFYKKQGYMELNDIHMDEDCHILGCGRRCNYCQRQQIVIMRIITIFIDNRMIVVYNPY